MKKNKLGVLEFGRKLVESGDLDPLYIALYEAGMSREKLCRWLIAYWCFYHAGLCCWICERKDFFGTLVQVAETGSTYPRGTERRHFRGDMSVKSTTKLGEQFNSGQSMIKWLGEGGPRATGIMKRIKSLYGFGEWISWKVPDMLDRLNLASVKFVDRDVELMFDASKKGALLTCEACGINSEDQLMKAHRYLIRYLGKLKSPPRYERRINVQETETIFCKWKSHLNGHYPVGKDTHEIIEGLQKYEPTTTSKKMVEVLERLKGASK